MKEFKDEEKKTEKRQAGTEGKEEELAAKLAKKTVGPKLDDAKLRYLMRKGKKPVIEEDSD